MGAFVNDQAYETVNPTKIPVGYELFRYGTQRDRRADQARRLVLKSWRRAARSIRPPSSPDPASTGRGRRGRSSWPDGRRRAERRIRSQASRTTLSAGRLAEP